MTNKSTKGMMLGAALAFAGIASAFTILATTDGGYDTPRQCAAAPETCSTVENKMTKAFFNAQNNSAATCLAGIALTGLSFAASSPNKKRTVTVKPS